MTPQQPTANKKQPPIFQMPLRRLLGQRIGGHREDVQRAQQDQADVGVEQPWDEGTIQPPCCQWEVTTVQKKKKNTACKEKKHGFEL